MAYTWTASSLMIAPLVKEGLLLDYLHVSVAITMFNTQMGKSVLLSHTNVVNA
jgi:hypothetical protein